MTHTCHRVAPLVGVVLAAVLFAGCGGNDPAAPDTPVELEDQLGFGESGIVERQSRVEGRIRDCMKAQGFDYVPVDPLAQRAALTGKARMSDEEFLDQFGYGISTLFGRGRRPSPIRMSGSAGASPRPTGRHTTARFGARTPVLRSRRPSTTTPPPSSAAARRGRPRPCSEEPRCCRRSRASSTNSRSASPRTSEWSERWKGGPPAWRSAATATTSPRRSTATC